MTTLLTTTLCCAFIVFAAAKELPKGIPKCSFLNNTCIEGAVRTTFRVLKDGAQEYGIPRIDPLFIEELIINEGDQKKPVNLKLQFNNLTLTGLSELDFYDGYLALKNNSVSILSRSEKMVLEGQYEMTGKILILTLAGKGNCQVTLKNTKMSTYIHFNPFTKNGDRYWDPDKYSITMKPEKVTMNFEKLFNTKQTELNEGMNQFLNENWELIYETISPALNEAFSLMFKGGAQRFLRKVPEKNIYSDYDKIDEYLKKNN